jgi:hypothetical protein
MTLYIGNDVVIERESLLIMVVSSVTICGLGRDSGGCSLYLGRISAGFL